MATARIFQEAKSSTQSGKARAGRWVLEFEPSERRHADPLMGWTGSGDTQAQVRLNFPTLDAAKAYAERESIPYHVVPAATPTLKIQSYADNFK
jgi:hypothetical protein